MFHGGAARSLYSKLKDEAQKNADPKHALTMDDVQALARTMPRTVETLAKVINPKQVDAHKDWILGITTVHHRDQEQFDECAAELRAFAQGGGYAWHMLQGVFRNVIKHYGMADEMTTVLDACGAYFDPFQNKLKRKRSDAETAAEDRAMV